MGGSVPGRTSLVRGSGLAVDVGVERSWCSHVEVFQQDLYIITRHKLQITS